MSPSPPPVDARRAAILDAALTEFAEKGFERASTNAIAAEAGVAKGLVFHYFGSKEELFLSVLDDVIAHLAPAFEETLEKAPKELFARVTAWTERKLQFLREDPRRLRFFFVAMVDAPEDLQSRARDRAERLTRGLMPRFLEGLDPSKLRPGVSPEDALEAVSTLTQGFERTLMPLLRVGKGASLKAVDQALDRAKKMFALLRDGIYRA